MLNLSVIGNLGRDAVTERGQHGDYISFSVAHSQKFTDQTGREVVQTTWVSCILNGRQDKLLPWLVKGTKVFVSGNMSVRLFRDRLGNWQAGINLNVRQIELCGSVALPKNEQQQGTDFSVQQQNSSPSSNNNNDEEVMPF